MTALKDYMTDEDYTWLEEATQQESYRVLFVEEALMAYSLYAIERGSEGKWRWE
jgi:hypothetical protein